MKQKTFKDERNNQYTFSIHHKKSLKSQYKEFKSKNNDKKYNKQKKRKTTSNSNVAQRTHSTRSKNVEQKSKYSFPDIIQPKQVSMIQKEFIPMLENVDIPRKSSIDTMELLNKLNKIHFNKELDTKSQFKQSNGTKYTQTTKPSLKNTSTSIDNKKENNLSKTNVVEHIPTLKRNNNEITPKITQQTINDVNSNEIKTETQTQLMNQQKRQEITPKIVNGNVPLSWSIEMNQKPKRKVPERFRNLSQKTGNYTKKCLKSIPEKKDIKNQKKRKITLPIGFRSKVTKSSATFGKAPRWR